MRGQLTLRQIMAAVAIIGVLLALFIHGPGFLLLIALFGLVFGFSKLPFRFRIAIEVAIVFALLALSAWLWRPPFYLQQAERAEEGERGARMGLETATDPRERAFFRREAEWYGRRASALRRTALWRGLIGGPSMRGQGPMGTRQLVEELVITEALERHEREADREHEAIRRAAAR